MLVGFQIINAGGRRIGWAIKTTNMKRLGVDPPCGVLDPKEAVLMAVSCDSFQFGQEDTNNDCITIGWTNNPDSAAKEFHCEWFQGDGMVPQISQFNTIRKISLSYFIVPLNNV